MVIRGEILRGVGTACGAQLKCGVPSRRTWTSSTPRCHDRSSAAHRAGNPAPCTIASTWKSARRAPCRNETETSGFRAIRSCRHPSQWRGLAVPIADVSAQSVLLLPECRGNQHIRQSERDRLSENLQFHGHAISPRFTGRRVRARRVSHHTHRSSIDATCDVRLSKMPKVRTHFLFCRFLNISLNVGVNKSTCRLCCRKALCPSGSWQSRDSVVAPSAFAAVRSCTFTTTLAFRREVPVRCRPGRSSPSSGIAGHPP